MSVAINSVNLKDEIEISFRRVDLSDDLVQSVSIDQTRGLFVATEPVKNGGRIVVYPQSPNNTNYSTVAYESFTGYGSLSMPLDARIDFTRNKVFVADAGNGRILKINAHRYFVESEKTGFTIPHAVVPELNKGGFFVKSFSDINTGIIHYYDKNFELVDYFSFPCSLGYETTVMQSTPDYVKSLPIPSTMMYDHTRWRLWWTAESYLYMVDIRNGQIVQNNLSPYIDTRGLDVQFNSGNSFVVVKNSSGDWGIIQVFRDNNYTFCESYVAKIEGM